MNDRQIDMSQYASPGAVAFGAEHFTPQIQNQIVDNYFNGGDSVHSAIANKIQELSSQQAPVISPDIQAKLERLEQLERVATDPRFVKAYAQALQTAAPTQPVLPPQPTQPQTAAPMDDDPFAGLFSNETPVNETQNVAQPQNVNNQPNEQQQYEQLVSVCTQNGIDANDFIQFAQSLSMEHLVGIYKAFREQSAQQTQAPLAQQTQQQEPPRSIQNVPIQNPTSPPASVFGQTKQRTLWD